MGKRLPHDASRWPSAGGGMRKHARSGVSHNHRITREMNRDAALEIERQSEIRKKRKGKMYTSVQELFKSVRGRL